jgi:hypothetical protein
MPRAGVARESVKAYSSSEIGICVFVEIDIVGRIKTRHGECRVLSGQESVGLSPLFKVN